MALAPTEKIKYSEAGPAGPARFEAGVAGYEASAFRGCGVFTSAPYETSDDTDSLQMLQRTSQVGEYYVMKRPVQMDDNDPNKSKCADILIYDEETDSHVYISLAEAIKHVGLDKLGDKYLQELKVQGKKESEVVDMVISGELAVVLCRPFIEHTMMSAVMAVAGRDTGATLFGPAGTLPLDTPIHPFVAPFLLLWTLQTSSNLIKPHQTSSRCCVRRHADLRQHLGQDD